MTALERRPLGAFEQTSYLFSTRRPVLHCTAIEFDGRLSASQVRVALGIVQGAHPLLRSAVTRTEAGLEFVACDGPIELTADSRSTDWTEVAAAELSRPLERAVGPPLRATLLTHSPSTTTLVLTCDHLIADGGAVLQLVTDLAGALAGSPVAPLRMPPAQERLMAELEVAGADTAQGGASTDARMNAPAQLADPGGPPPSIATGSLSAAATARLASACRAEHTTVQGLLVGAAIRALGESGVEFARVLNPIDLRRHASLPDEVANRIVTGRVGLATGDHRDLWSLARAAREQIAATLDPAVLSAAAAALEPVLPADEDSAEALTAAGMGSDVSVTNLGVFEPHLPAAGRPRTVWAPGVRHVAGGQTVGVLTYQGRLRLTDVAQGTSPWLAGRMVELIESAVAG